MRLCGIKHYITITIINMLYSVVCIGSLETALKISTLTLEINTARNSGRDTVTSEPINDVNYRCISYCRHTHVCTLYSVHPYCLTLCCSLQIVSFHFSLGEKIKTMNIFVLEYCSVVSHVEKCSLLLFPFNSFVIFSLLFSALCKLCMPTNLITVDVYLLWRFTPLTLSTTICVEYI